MTDFGADRDKYRSLRGRARIRELFWQEWDPIGVNDSDCPKSEYDRYADKAYAMLMEGRSALEIADYLYYVSSEHMSLGKGQELRDLAKTVAAKLVALKSTLESESNEPF